MENQHVLMTGPVARWENVTALACLCTIHLAVLANLFLFAFPVFCPFVFHLPLWFPYKRFPIKPPFCHSFISLIYFYLLCSWCCVCVFPFFELFFSVTGLFVFHLFARFVSLFQNDPALFLDSRSANANAECNNMWLCSQCSCHLVYSEPL